MELFMEALQSIFIPQVVAALIGGLLGACTSIKVELHGWRISILLAIASLIIAGAISEYLTYNFSVKFILLHCGLGLLVGILGNSLLNAINVAAPDFMVKLVDVLFNGIIQVVKEIPALAIKKLEDMFNWLKLLIRKDTNE